MRTAAGARVVRHGDRRGRDRLRRVLRSGGELLVTAGLVLLLLVAHQLWWTNREARRGAERTVAALEREWESGTAAGPGVPPGGSGTAAAPEPAATPGTSRAPRRPDTPAAPPRRSRAYAVLAIPRLHLRVPVAEGVSAADVLNKGYVGHYRGTQQPGRAGNFALAGHRNTHGEPFRYLPRLRRGDAIEVATRSATYTYHVDQVLPRTSALDSGVLRPVPRSLVRPGYGYDEPGFYLTLTTCTPEFTSRYRLVVWGKLVSMRPR
ncbi:MULTISPECIES: class E sortase [Streptomyces]|uniref:Class E sortase n=1 Tax=Streptomyces bangladeshensis TaxID=295352 RepID=A0ABP5N6L0_9ACTN|nr:class E sortase [Streptomyces sp. FBKL.4005]OYP17393.1 class E sortase [Streptomyces sp. FBKL.4005]CUW28746.1 Sortase family protein [Streptomyces reticuli]